VSDAVDYRKYARVSREIGANAKDDDQLIWSMLARRWSAVADRRKSVPDQREHVPHGGGITPPDSDSFEDAPWAKQEDARLGRFANFQIDDVDY
jgi:hypothetical protein